MPTRGKYDGPPPGRGTPIPQQRSSEIDRSNERRRAGTAPLALAMIALANLLFAAGCGSDRAHFAAPIEGAARPAAEVEARTEARRLAGETLDAAGNTSILFGDLHVHSSYSFDGYLFALPLLGGEGAHPPNDACDFARYCADLDFFALTDHAESLHADTWRASRESIRACNEQSGDPTDPDLVAFLGFEWSQAGLTPEEHWGHRCVFFRDTADRALPTRPIGAPPNDDAATFLRNQLGALRWLTPWHWYRYGDYIAFTDRMMNRPFCADGVAVRDLPEDCREVARTPAILNEKLDDWGFDAMVVPHGTAWGTYTPATSSIARQLDPVQFDPARQVLIEIMSGHGNSEEFRTWNEFRVGDDGAPICPEPTADYLPCCWQAGEIMRARCGDLSDEECERRVVEARRYAAEAWTLPRQVFPDSSLEDWLDCGQCRDCFKPSFAYRPRESIQYAMALARPQWEGEEGRPLRFRYGFIASSDNHTARPGTGYKPVERGMMTDAVGEPSLLVRGFQKLGSRMDDPRQPIRPATSAVSVAGNDLRVGDYLFPGGIAAVHATGRSREEIWDAMQARRVYGTSGPRILLWFDLVDEDGTRLPMGTQTQSSRTPRFEVRAAGAPLQKPGCPDWTHKGLSRERLERLCRGECNHPSDRRHAIEAIEVVRIRMQRHSDEPIAPLIEDPWRRFPCPPDPAGCRVSFEDPDFATDGRDALYYVRALQEATLEINGDPLRTQFDEAGKAVGIEVCDPGTGDCLAPSHERAWSSPIFVDHEPAPAAEVGASPEGSQALAATEGRDATRSNQAASLVQSSGSP
jgi:hypothetical protein